ncbi:MAG: hypothetical protein ACKVJF_12285, partial [Flavobacteriales bacterium]
LKAKASLNPMYELPKKGGATITGLKIVLFLGNKTAVGSFTLNVEGTSMILLEAELNPKLIKIKIMISGQKTFIHLLIVLIS